MKTKIEKGVKRLSLKKEKEKEKEYNKLIEETYKFKVKDWFFITMGAILVAIASNFFFDKFELVTGGVIGIGIILKDMYNIPLWITNIVLNIPLFLIAVMIKGKKLGFKSLYGTLVLTLALNLTQTDYMLTEDIMLGAIFGAVVSGAGLGFVFSGLGTTGGTDLLAIIIKHFVPHISIGRALGTIESIIIVLGAFVFGTEKALLAIIAVYITTKVTDSIVDGAKFGKTVYIISNKYEDISKVLLKEVERGVTALNGVGMYSKEEKKVIMCVVSTKQLPLVKTIVCNIDKDAFMFVNDTREVLGNGFVSNAESL